MTSIERTISELAERVARPLECDRLILGQLLNEIQAQLPHGEFLPWIKKVMPDVSYECAARWARAAANVEKCLPLQSFDMSLGEILMAREERLSIKARQYRQMWLQFITGKSLSDCLKLRPNARLLNGSQKWQMPVIAR